MKKAASKILLLFVALCLILNNSPVYAVAKESESEVDSSSSFSEPDSFSGTRHIEITADISDVENFINGGRPMLDMAIRSNAPEWLSYNIHAVDRDLLITLDFTFESLGDYTEKVKALLTNHPTIVLFQNEEDNDFTYLEGFSAIQLLNFVQQVLISSGLTTEKAMTEIFVVKNNAITINTVEYASDNKSISIRPDNSAIVTFNNLSLTTTVDKNNVFKRTISVSIDKSLNKNSDIKELIKRFSDIGKKTDDTTDGFTYVSVEFTAVNQVEMLKKTMFCLNTATSVSEQQTLDADRNITVDKTEYIDTECVLDEEGTFSYVFEFPSYYESVSSADENVTVTETSISSSTGPNINFTYKSGFKFSSIDITTDLSSTSGKIKKIIRFSAPAEIATAFHDQIVSRYEEKLINGTTFNIYDENGYRNYEFRFETFFSKDIAEFTSAILGGECTFELTDNWLPYGKSSIKETTNIKYIIDKKTPADEITSKYKFSSVSKILTTENLSLNGNSASLLIAQSASTAIEYRQLNIVKTIAEAILIIIAVILLIIAIRKIKNLIDALKEKAEAKKAEKDRNQNESQTDKPADESAPFFCPFCGEEAKSDDIFCNECGNKLPRN